jgi:hypothetical protein
VAASRWWWTEGEGEGKVCIREPLACGGSGGAREPSGDKDDRAAFVASGTSKGFGRSWPSLARGVSCSNTDGHNLSIALDSGKNDSEDRDEGECAGVGCMSREAATDMSECGLCGAAGVAIGIIAPPSSAIGASSMKQSLATHIGAVAIRTSARTLHRIDSDHQSCTLLHGPRLHTFQV